jgi:ABC-type multidrug transport system fused ATPase/permease subunit
MRNFISLVNSVFLLISNKNLLTLIFTSFILFVFDFIGISLIASAIYLLINHDKSSIHFDLFNTNIPIVFLCSIGIFCAAIRSAAAYYAKKVNLLCQNKIQSDIFIVLLNSYLNQKYLKYIQTQIADKNRFLINEVNNINIFLDLLVSSALEFIFLISVSILSLYKYGIYPLFIIIFFLFLLILFQYFLKDLLNTSGEHRYNVNSIFNSTVYNALISYREIKLYRLLPHVVNSISKLRTNLNQLNSKVHALESSPKLYFDFIVVLIILLLIFFIQNNSESDFLNSLDVPILSAILYRMLPSFNKITSNWVSIQHYSISLVNLFNEYDKLKNSQDFLHKEVSDHNQFCFKYLVFESICFGYGSDLIFDNLTISFDSGDVVYIKGESGSGKSTLLDLLTEFINPSSGSIYLVDCFANKLKISDAKVGYASQEPILFNGSFWDNITLNRNLSLSDTIYITNFVIDIGMEFLLDSKFTILNSGSNLSGGQKRRLSVIRALSDKPNILIMDEVSSSIDSESERLLFNALKKLNIDFIFYTSHNNSILYANKIVSL